MNRYASVATGAVSIIIGTIAALWFNRADIALGLVGLGGSLTVALGVHQRGQALKKKGQPPA